MIRALLTRVWGWWTGPVSEVAPELPKTLTDFQRFRANAEASLYTNWEKKHGRA